MALIDTTVAQSALGPGGACHSQGPLYFIAPLSIGEHLIYSFIIGTALTANDNDMIPGWCTNKIPWFPYACKQIFRIVQVFSLFGKADMGYFAADP